MIAESGITPKPVLNPKGTMQQGVILLRGPKVEPYTEEPIPGTQFGRGHVAAVIPNDPSMPGRLVDQEHRRN